MTHSAEQLIRCGRGDAGAFAELYRATSAHLFALALRILRRREWAEEALQEGFSKIWRHASDYDRAKGAPLTWMGSIVRNTALDRLRRAKRESPVDPEGPIQNLQDEGPGPFDQAAQGMEAKALQRCLETLTQEQRESLSLAYWRGLTHIELAAALKKPLGTVKTWVRRGLDQLRKCLEG
ncbi:sigma-70 family RNA polymerase sigma factor [bacterium]|nr:MAG: sigma-70 family RNA polymerase sigma factor [bacterium]